MGESNISMRNQIIKTKVHYHNDLDNGISVTLGRKICIPALFLGEDIRNSPRFFKIIIRR